MTRLGRASVRTSRSSPSSGRRGSPGSLTPSTGHARCLRGRSRRSPGASAAGSISEVDLHVARRMARGEPAMFSAPDRMAQRRRGDGLTTSARCRHRRASCSRSCTLAGSLATKAATAPNSSTRFRNAPSGSSSWSDRAPSSTVMPSRAAHRLVGHTHALGVDAAGHQDVGGHAVGGDFERECLRPPTSEVRSAIGNAEDRDRLHDARRHDRQNRDPIVARACRAGVRRSAMITLSTMSRNAVLHSSVRASGGAAIFRAAGIVHEDVDRAEAVGQFLRESPEARRCRARSSRRGHPLGAVRESACSSRGSGGSRARCRVR